MFKGFKEFIMRGNLVELAVAFIMVLAFVPVVLALVNVIMSLITLIAGDGFNFNAWQPSGVPVGAFITALITFVIIALVVYFFIVVPYNRLQARRAQGVEDATPPSDEVTLLTEIRDLLASRRF